MKYSYAQRKRINSLATRYLHSYDGLIETKDLNQMYHSEFMAFVEDLLVEFHGFKREDPKPVVHRPRKVGERPEKRKPGERPPRIGEELKPKESTALSPNREKEIMEEVERSVDDTKPTWYKKAWRKVMMEVHPDRIDLVSKNELDKLERLKVADRLRLDKGSEILIACANKLEITIEMNIFEQERIMRTANHRILKETKGVHNSVSWIWGESAVDTNLRLQVIKNVLKNNNINPVDDSTLIEFMLKKSVT